MELLNVGHENFVSRVEVDAIFDAGSSLARETIQRCRDNGDLLDMTCGRRERALIRLKSGTMATSSLTCETLARRLSTASIAPEDSHG